MKYIQNYKMISSKFELSELRCLSVIMNAKINVIKGHITIKGVIVILSNREPPEFWFFYLIENPQEPG